MIHKQLVTRSCFSSGLLSTSNFGIEIREKISNFANGEIGGLLFYKNFRWFIFLLKCGQSRQSHFAERKGLRLRYCPADDELGAKRCVAWALVIAITGYH